MARISEKRSDYLLALIKPIVRYALRSDQKLRDVLQVLKIAFVEVAIEQLEARGEKASASRVSFMSGVHKQDLGKILERDGDTNPSNNALEARVIGQWEQSAAFTTRDKRPRVLTYKGAESEFWELVKTVDKHHSPKVVLNELLRVGAVEKTARGVKLKSGRHRSQKNDFRVFGVMSQDISDLIESVEQNVLDEQEARNLHLRTEYDNVSVEKVPEIRRWLLKEGKAFHKKMRDYLSQFDRDVNPDNNSAAGARVAVSAFSITETPERGDESE